MSDFRPIRPLTITDARLTATTVPETVAATYNAGTTYALDAKVGLAPVDGAAQLVYKSLQNSNIGHTPASSPTWWEYIGSVYPVYNAGVTYANKDTVSSISTNVHKLYLSLAGGNLGNPLTDATKWLDIGATNGWKMFDAISASQTVQPNKIIFNLTPASYFNSMAFLNVAAISIRVQQTITGYDETVLMNSHPVLNWYDWWFEPLYRRDEMVFMDIPPYASSVLTITIDNTGGDAAVGVAVLGSSRILGKTQWGVGRGIKDFSRVVEDQWGGLVVVQGNYAKTMDCEVHISPGFESEAVHILTDLRATPAVFVASEDYDSAIIYGILQEWNVPISNSGELTRISIRGLV